MFGFSPYEGIRLGKEIGQLVKYYGIGGVFHSDELPNYGIEEKEISIVNDVLNISDSDAFLIIAAPNNKIDFIIQSIISRIENAKHGIPAETRLATQNGETVFLRPRPGASRMYPETDVPPIIISELELNQAKENIPKSYEDSLLEIEKKYGLNRQLSEQVFDSKYYDLFEKISKQTNVNPTFIASQLCSTITNLERKNLDSDRLKSEDILKSFEFLQENKIAKESIELIFESIMSGKSKSITEAIEESSVKSISDEELEEKILKIINDNSSIIQNQRERAIGPLMGIVMKELRGKASGEKINNLLAKHIELKLKE